MAQRGMLEFPCGVERLPNGNTLIADAGDETSHGSEIIEVDSSGGVVWNYSEGLFFAHSAVALANGNILISDTSHNRILEVTRKSEVAFDSCSWGDGTGRLSDGSTLSYPNDAHEVSGGDLLITDRNNDRVLIVGRRGEVIWTYTRDLHHPHNADQTANGNVLIADSDRNRVIEVTPAAKVVWKYGSELGHERLEWPRDADRLANGNTLICDSKASRVIEVDPEGRLVWEYRAPHFANFYEADALPNGNVLIADQQHHRVFEVDRSGRIVWEFQNLRSRFPVHDRLTNGFFKQHDDEDGPAGWFLLTRAAEGGGTVSWDRDDAGRPCVRLEYDRRGALCLTQLVGVTPGRRYRFGGTIRCHGIVDGAFAALQLAFRDDQGGLLVDAMQAPKGRLLTGSMGWVDDIVEALTPANAAAVEVRLLMTGPGTAWISRAMLVDE